MMNIDQQASKIKIPDSQTSHKHSIQLDCGLFESSYISTPDEHIYEDHGGPDMALLAYPIEHYDHEIKSISTLDPKLAKHLSHEGLRLGDENKKALVNPESCERRAAGDPTALSLAFVGRIFGWRESRIVKSAIHRKNQRFFIS